MTREAWYQEGLNSAPPPKPLPRHLFKLRQQLYVVGTIKRQKEYSASTRAAGGRDKNIALGRYSIF